MQDSANPPRSSSRSRLPKWPFAKDEILFVSNQLNTDVLGAERYGIRTAWLSAPEFRSADETMPLDDVKPTFTLGRLTDLPALLKRDRDLSRNKAPRG